MKVEDLAALAVSACEEEGVAFMVTGAFACGYCGIPRSTKDVDLVLGVEDRSGIERVIARLASDVDCEAEGTYPAACGACEKSSSLPKYPAACGGDFYFWRSCPI